MDKIKRVTIGVSTYGTLPRVNGFLKSLWSNLDAGPFEVSVVCCDDGTPHLQAVREREEFCSRWNCAFIRNESNLGIPATWNRLAAHDPNADLVFIANDDIRFLAPGWLTRLIFFFEKNEDIGMVGVPLVQEPTFDDADPRWWGQPGRVGAPVGCSYAVRPRDLFSIENPEDGSRGFLEALISFHEETTGGFRLAEKNKPSVMLPWPPLYHGGGQTFQANPELIWRTPHPYLPLEEFLHWVKQSRWLVADYLPQYELGRVDRMSYSRTYFCKIFSVLAEIEAGRRIQEIKGEEVDLLDEPQKWVHARLVDPIPTRTVRWLDRDGKEMEGPL